MRGRDGENEPTPEAFDRWRDLLGAESEQHDPSEEVMWARVESAMAGADGGSTRRRRRVGLRVAAAAVATAAAIGSAVAMRLTGPDGTPVVPVAEGTGTPRVKPSSPDSATPSGSGPGPGKGGTATSSSSPTSSATSKSTRAPVTSDDAVAATASLDPNSSAYWAQHNVVLKVGRPLDRLTVSIRIARAGKVSPTGSWLTLPTGDFEIATENAGDDVVYRWTLRAGRSVPVGTHTLAAQYNRGAGHDPRKDTFTVTAAAGDKKATLSGHF